MGTTRCGRRNLMNMLMLMRQPARGWIDSSGAVSRRGEVQRGPIFRGGGEGGSQWFVVSAHWMGRQPYFWSASRWSACKTTDGMVAARMVWVGPPEKVVRLQPFLCSRQGIGSNAWVCDAGPSTVDCAHETKSNEDCSCQVRSGENSVRIFQ